MEMGVIKVFVTGIAGFVGRNLVEILLARGYEVIGFIRADLRDRKPEIYHYLKRNVKLIYGNITDLESIIKALDSVYGEEAITLIHLAAIIDSKRTALFQEINVNGTENLYRAVLQSRTPINHIIHVSTAAVHGPQHPNEKITESTSFLPETLYEKSKYNSELIARKFMEENSLPITIFRPVHVYGPHAVDHLLLPMIKMMHRGFVIAPAKQSLDLVYVANLVDAILLAIEQKGKSAGQTYIVADSKNYTTDDVIDSLKKIFNIEPVIVHIPRFAIRAYSKLTKKLRYGLNNVTYSCDKAKEQLGYEPKITLDDGFRAYVGWLVTAGYLNSHYIISKPEAANESLSGFKGVGCAYDYVIRLKTVMPLYRKAVRGKTGPSLLLVTPRMKFCPPLEIAHLKRSVRNLQMRRVVIPYSTPTSSQIQEYLRAHQNKKYDLSLYVGEDLDFDALRTLTETFRTISNYAGIFVHNGDNAYHLGHWQGITAESVCSLGPSERKHVDVPLMPANIQLGSFHEKSMSRLKHAFILSLCLAILLISELEDKFPEVVRKKMAHQLFLAWAPSPSNVSPTMVGVLDYGLAGKN
jgi:nucleoside-diphosphate-sugar epimerase